MTTQPKHKTIVHETRESSEAEHHHHFASKKAWLREQVAKKAFELYENRGSIEGKDIEDWLEAEKLIQAGLNIEH